MKIIVEFEKPIDSKKLYDSFNGGIHKRLGNEELSIKVNVIDMISHTYLVVDGGCAELISVCIHCWDYAPFNISVEVPERGKV